MRYRIKNKVNWLEQNGLAGSKVAPYDGIFVGFLPEHRKFELKLDTGDILYGSATIDAADQYISLIARGSGVINERWVVDMEVRTIKPLNRPEKKVYKLKEFLKKIENDE